VVFFVFVLPWLIIADEFVVPGILAICGLRIG
jgi:hypothetical protein